MSTYEKAFKKILNEGGPNYVPTIGNTAGAGGSLGNAPSMYTQGSASGTTGTDSYNIGDARVADMLGAIQTRKGAIKPKKKKKKK